MMHTEKPLHAVSLQSSVGDDAYCFVDADRYRLNLSTPLPGIGPDVALLETQYRLNPFAVMASLSLQPPQGARPTMLVVMPMSGQYGRLVYDLAAGLLVNHDVAVLDWTNARDVPASEGRFGFDGMIASIIDAMGEIGQNSHLIGLCQSTVPAIAAATIMFERSDPVRPCSLTLMGGPVDPQQSATRVSTALQMTPICWLEQNAIKPVSAMFAGSGRLVYPSDAHREALRIYFHRHLLSGDGIARKLIFDDGSDPEKFPFESICLDVKDIPAPAFLESIAAIYHQRAIWTANLYFDGHLVEPQNVSGLPVLTIEAPEDDISAPGQTIAAHRLFKSAPRELCGHYELSEGGHFDLIHGRECRNAVVPVISEFVSAITG